MADEFKLNFNSLGFVVSKLTELIRDPTKDYRVTVKQWRKRSLDANAQVFVWHKQVAQYKHCDVKTAEARNKIDFGVPIMLDDPDYGPILGYILDKTGFWQMSYEQQEKMIQGIEVTRKMNTKQHNLYRDNIQMYWYENGLALEYKNEE